MAKVRREFGILFVAALLASVMACGQTTYFNYPGVGGTGIRMQSDKFGEMSKEWRGTDYYYSGVGKDGMICSVLYYKLNDDEVKNLIELPAQLVSGPASSPAYPQVYFATYSNTKKYETNEDRWGNPTADFMYRQMDIKEFEGQVANQKNMFAYAMFGKDIFVNIHLSKANCTAADSIEMRRIVESVTKTK